MFIVCYDRIFLSSGDLCKFVVGDVLYFFLLDWLALIFVAVMFGFVCVVLCRIL